MCDSIAAFSAAATCVCQPHHDDDFTHARAAYVHASRTPRRMPTKPSAVRGTTTIFEETLAQANPSADNSGTACVDESCECIAASHTPVAVTKRVSDIQKIVDIATSSMLALDPSKPAISVDILPTAAPPPPSYLSVLRISLPSRAPPRL